MWDMISTAASNSGVSFEYIIIIILVLGSIIIAAKDVRIALIINLVMSAGVFMWFFTEDLNYRPILIVFFMTLIVLAFTLYVTNKETGYRGIT